jgi:hypothetical protein
LRPGVQTPVLQKKREGMEGRKGKEERIAGYANSPC